MRAFALCLAVAACGDDGQPIGPPCTGLCTPPSLTKLDRVAGQPGGPGHVDGPLVAAHLTAPWNVASDGAGHLYITDANMIRAVDLASGSVTTLAGVYGASGTTDGVGSAARFFQPQGLAATPAAVYVADTENHTIRQIDVASARVTTLAGTAGLPGASDGIGNGAGFREPEGLALDGAGHLLIVDTDNFTIRRMDLASGMVTTIAGSALQSGSVDDVGTAARFYVPQALSYDSGALFIVDRGNSKVRKLDLSSLAVTTLATFDCSLPLGIVVANGRVLVSIADGRIMDAGNSTVFSGAPNVRAFVDGALADARFSSPAGMYFDGSKILLADLGNAVIRGIDIGAGTVGTYIGSNSAGTGDGSAARFHDAEGMAVDEAGVIYLADTKNHTIRKIAGGNATTIAGAAGQMGFADGADARFNLPTGVALAAGQLYIADSGNHLLRRLDLASGAVSTIATPSSFGYPTGLALDGGLLYVTDYQKHTVLAVDPMTAAVTPLAGSNGMSGATDGVGASALFHSPIGIAADGRGNLFVADVLNHTLRKIVIKTGAVTTLAGKPRVAGFQDGRGDGAMFNYPAYVSANGRGDLFVADTLNQLVRRVDTNTGAVTTVIGTPSLPGVALGPLPSQIGQPWSLALTHDGGLALFSENAILVAH